VEPAYESGGEIDLHAKGLQGEFEMRERETSVIAVSFMQINGDNIVVSFRER
jgi:hypothetical protein